MTKQYPLISIIVPIYKVEKYLRQCLDSLVAQTYPNYEVILMDDGSPDNCPKICDEYAGKYKHFKVIHQQNMGLVRSRLNILPCVSGELLAFVDGDDWVDPDYLSYLYQLRAEYQADISVCAPYNMGSLYRLQKKPRLADTATALRVMLSGNFYAGYIWNKLYPKAVWQDLPLPPQNMFEDLFFNTHIVPKVKKVVFCAVPKYHYRIVQGSMSHSGFKEERLFFFTIVDYVKKWALQQHETATYCRLVAVQLIAYWRNWIHCLRNNKNKDFTKKLRRLRPDMAWYFKLDRQFFMKWRSVFWLLTEYGVEDFYAVFCRKQD